MKKKQPEKVLTKTQQKLIDKQKLFKKINEDQERIRDFKFNPDLQVIKDKTDCITDLVFEYYNSRYQLSDFYNKSFINKKPFLLELKNGKFYKQDEKGLELAVLHLASIYQDLDSSLKRLNDGYNDPMFLRFAFKSGMFNSEYHWQMVLRNWYLGWSWAIRRYYNGKHKEYDPNSGLSYVQFFNIYFSDYLFYSIDRIEQYYKENASSSYDPTGLSYYNYTTNELVRLDQYNMNSKHTFEDLSINSHDYEMDTHFDYQSLQEDLLSEKFPFSFQAVESKLQNLLY